MSDQQTTILAKPIGGTDPNTRPTRRELAWNGGTDLGLLILRFAIGGVFVAHGMQRLFGLWGGPGIDAFARELGTLGYTQTSTLAWVTGVTELIAGGFVVLGVITPLAASGLLAIMINVVLLRLTAGGGFFAGTPNGVELEVVLGLGAAALVFTGAGRIALERGRTWHRRPGPWGVLALIIGVAAGLAVYFLLRTPPAI